LAAIKLAYFNWPVRFSNFMKCSLLTVQVALSPLLLIGFHINCLAQPAKPAFSTNATEYPKVNLAPQYEVDAKWPQRSPEAPWGHVAGIAIDKQDNVWIYTRTNPVVQIYAPDGRYLRGWRNDDPRTTPHFIKFDAAGNVWLADAGLHTVTKHSPDGKVLQTLGTLGVPGNDASHLFKPTDMTFAPNGDIFVADGYGNSRVVQFDKQGRYVNAWGTLGTEPGRFSIPHAITSDSKGRLYVADRNNVRIQVFDQKGKLLDIWSNVVVPWGFWTSPADDIWVCGSSPMPWILDPKYPTAPLGCPPKDQVFMKFNSQGRLLQLWTVPKGADGEEKPGELNWLHCMALDSKGNIYCGDIIGKRLQKFVRKN
jgi:peptidylamidoglycolate lyase